MKSHIVVRRSQCSAWLHTERTTGSLTPAPSCTLPHAPLPWLILICPFTVETTTRGITAFLSSVSPSSEFLHLRVMLGTPRWAAGQKWGWSWGLRLRKLPQAHSADQSRTWTGAHPSTSSLYGSFQTADFLWEALPSCFSQVLQLHSRARLHSEFRSWWGELITEKRPTEEVKRKRRGRGKPHVSHWTDSTFSCKLNLFFKVIPDKKTTSLSLFAFI